MNKNSIEILEKSLLIITPICLALIGCGYLINTDFYPNTYGFSAKNLNSEHIYRAIGAMYCSMSLFWFLSLKNKSWRKVVIISILFFMSGLAIGRIISIIFDGIPHTLLLIFLILELICFIQAWIVYQYKYSENKKNDF
jgi:hypothetical protein